MKIITNLKTPKYLLSAFGVAFLVFDISYYLMSTLPGSRNEMCVMGANLTPLNISFGILLSLMFGVLGAGFWGLYDANLQILAVQRGREFETARTGTKVALTSLSGIGAFLGVMTMFCTACTLPVISFLGVSFGLQFFTDNNIFFKVASVLLVLLAAYYLNRQLHFRCAACKYESVTKE